MQQFGPFAWETKKCVAGPYGARCRVRIPIGGETVESHIQGNSVDAVELDAWKGMALMLANKLLYPPQPTRPSAQELPHGQEEGQAKPVPQGLCE